MVPFPPSHIRGGPDLSTPFHSEEGEFPGELGLLGSVPVSLTAFDVENRQARHTVTLLATDKNECFCSASLPSSSLSHRTVSVNGLVSTQAVFTPRDLVTSSPELAFYKQDFFFFQAAAMGALKGKKNFFL